MPGNVGVPNACSGNASWWSMKKPAVSKLVVEGRLRLGQQCTTASGPVASGHRDAVVYLSPSLLNHKARSLRSSSLVGLPDASSVSCMLGCKEVRRPRRKLMMSGGTLYNRLLLLLAELTGRLCRCDSRLLALLA